MIEKMIENQSAKDFAEIADSLMNHSDFYLAAKVRNHYQSEIVSNDL